MRQRRTATLKAAIDLYRLLASLNFAIFAMPKKIDWSAIEKKYRGSTDSPAVLALQFGVSKRSIEIKAEAEGWRAEREAKIALSQPPKPVDSTPASPRPPRTPKPKLPDHEIVNDALYCISTTMSDADARSLGSLASGLVRLLEYRRKIDPPTVAELADQAIALGCTPDNFWKQLGEAWQRQQA